MDLGPKVFSPRGKALRPRSPSGTKCPFPPPWQSPCRPLKLVRSRSSPALAQADTQGPAHRLGPAAPRAAGAGAEPRAIVYAHVRDALPLIVPRVEPRGGHTVRPLQLARGLIAKGRALYAVSPRCPPNREDKRGIPVLALLLRAPLHPNLICSYCGELGYRAVGRSFKKEKKRKKVRKKIFAVTWARAEL